MQNFGATIKKHYGMLWYFLEWPIKQRKRYAFWWALEFVSVKLFFKVQKYRKTRKVFKIFESDSLA